MADLIYSALPQPRRPILYVHPDISVAQCIDIMIKENIGALVVCDDDNKLIGMVTERDIVRNCLQIGSDIHNTTAGQVVFTDVSVLDILDPVEDAMEVITQTKRRHILIAEQGELIAILSIGDLLFHILEDKTRVIEQLENYIHTY